MSGLSAISCSLLDLKASAPSMALTGLIGATTIAFGILPPAYAPLAALLGGAMSVAHLKRSP